METVNPPVQLLEIERELSGPDKMEHLARYDNQLVTLAKRLETALNQGMAPDEYSRAQDLRETITLARKILRLTVRADGQSQNTER